MARYPPTGSSVSLSVSTKQWGDALDRGNCRGLMLTEQVMKVLERIVDGLIRQVVSIDDSHFGFVPGRAFVDLEKAFDRVPRKFIWWALRKLGDYSS